MDKNSLCYLKSSKGSKKLFHISSSYKKFFSSKEKIKIDPIQFLKTHLIMTPRLNKITRNSPRIHQNQRNLNTPKLIIFKTENQTEIINQNLSPKLIIRKRCSRNFNQKNATLLSTKNSDQRNKEILSINEIKKLFEAKNQDNQLIYTQISFNRFSEFCANNCIYGKINLSDMGLSYNSSKILKEILLSNDKITILNISKNFIGDQGIEIISSSFPHLVSLVHLDISSNSITSKGAFYLFKYLIKNETLSCLDISSFPRSPKNNLSELNKTSIINYLSCTLQLMFLDLHNCFMIDSSIVCLAEAMLKNQSIIKIDLSFNLFTDKSAKPFIQILKSTKLHTINFSENYVKNNFKNEFSKNFNRSNQIYCKKIYFCNCDFTEQCNQNFFCTLVNIPSISSLYFDKNHFASCNSSLQYLFLNNFNLKHISLSYCFLNDDSMNQISFGLKISQSIASINLSNNFISNPGVIALFGAFVENFGRLNRLDISFNKISNEGCHHFAKLLLLNYPLYYLNLSGNNISTFGGEEIACAVKKNKFIIYLGLQSNFIEPFVLKEINIFLMKNMNKIKTKDQESIEEYIQENINVIDEYNHVEKDSNLMNVKNNTEIQNIEKLKMQIDKLRSTSTLTQLFITLDNLEKENSDFDLKLEEMNNSIMAIGFKHLDEGKLKLNISNLEEEKQDLLRRSIII